MLVGKHRRVRYALGLMAGTSADGIDAAIVRIVGEGESMRVRFLHHYHMPYKRDLRRRLLAVMAPAATATEEIARLHATLGEAFGEAAKRAIQQVQRRQRPSVISLSGQTICHLPHDRNGVTVTLQLGSAAHVAAMAGVPVVSDFRQSDVAAGGQGAPLVPWTDWVLFHDDRRSRAIQNIGGIGNVTWLPAGGGPADVVAFDTGPGNMVIDEIVARASDNRRRMDRDGHMAGRGTVIESILARWMRHPFLRKQPPRTTGREEFGRTFVDRYWPILKTSSLRSEDWIATATAFTARSIADSYRRFIPRLAENVWPPTTAFAEDWLGGGRADRDVQIQIVLTGGGSRNRTLRRMLEMELPGVSIVRIDDLGIPDQAKEAVSFAMLAVARLDGVASNLPQVTGANKAVTLGAFYP